MVQGRQERLSATGDTTQPAPDLSPVKFDGSGDAGTASETANSASVTDSTDASLIMSVLNSKHSQRKMAVTETEAIMLYKMIRDVGREVSHDFHEYKKNVHQDGGACADYDDLPKMVTEAREGQDAITQLQMEHLLRKNRREIDGRVTHLAHSLVLKQ